MKVFAIDDEQAMLEELHETILVAEPEAEVLDFKRAKPALEAIENQGAPDVVFCDIELPGMDGLTFASRLKTIAPDAKLVFVTAYPDYAVDAFRVHVDGFVVKPVEPDRIREELNALFPGGHVHPKLHVRCFGNFDVFYGNEPLALTRTRSKELFAFLVDRNGGICTGAEIAQALWENDEVKNPMSYLRMLTLDLRNALAAVNMEDALLRGRNQWAIRTEMIDCDYFRMLEGDPSAIEDYHGEYMKQYSWAEQTAAKLHFIRERFLGE